MIEEGSEEYRPMPDSLINRHYDDCYFSNTHGLEESLHVFVRGNELPERIRAGEELSVGETGFGTGLNLLALLKTIREEAENRRKLRYCSLEKYPLKSSRIEELLMPFRAELGEFWEPYLKVWDAFLPTLKPGWNRTEWRLPGTDLSLSLYYGDALDWSADPGEEDIRAWFLDGHSPDKNPVIWSQPVMHSVYGRTAPGGTLASFTASGTVKRALREAGFFIKRSPGFGRKRHMIRGSRS